MRNRINRSNLFYRSGECRFLKERLELGESVLEGGSDAHVGLGLVVLEVVKSSSDGDDYDSQDNDEDCKSNSGGNSLVASKNSSLGLLGVSAVARDGSGRGIEGSVSRGKVVDGSS